MWAGDTPGELPSVGGWERSLVELPRVGGCGALGKLPSMRSNFVWETCLYSDHIAWVGRGEGTEKWRCCFWEKKYYYLTNWFFLRRRFRGRNPFKGGRLWQPVFLNNLFRVLLEWLWLVYNKLEIELSNQINRCDRSGVQYEWVENWVVEIRKRKEHIESKKE